MNNELKLLFNKFKSLSNDIERKDWFYNNRATIIPLLADLFESDRDHCEVIIEDFVDLFPKGSKGRSRKDIKLNVKMEIDKRIRERNKDHFTEEVNFERDPQGNVKATIENMVMVLLKNKNIYVTKDEFTGMQFYAAFGTYNLPWANSTHTLQINYKIEHVEKGVTSIRYYPAMGAYELASLKVYMQQFFKTETNWRMMKEAIIQAAQQNVVNIYQDYMKYGLPEWDGIDRLDFLYRFAGVKNKKWAIVVAKSILLAIMARCFIPGYDYRGIAIFEGKQNIGKSRLARAFAFLAEFFTQFTFDKNHNEYEVSRRLAAKAIVEFPDMGGIGNRDNDYIKAFFTATNDSNRKMHQDLVENVKRMWVPIITTNHSEPYLNDQTGNSRYLPVACETDHIDIEAIEKEMPMLLAQALTMWKAGETPRLNDDEIKLQNEMLKPREIISDYFYWLLPIIKLHRDEFKPNESNWDDGATLDEIVNWCSGEDWFPSKPRHKHKTKISSILKTHFRIDSVVKAKRDGQTVKSTRKYRYMGGKDFDAFFDTLGMDDTGYTDDA